MALSKRDRIGAMILVGMFAVFGLLLFFTVDRPSGPIRSLENNIIVEQRIRAIEQR